MWVERNRNLNKNYENSTLEQKYMTEGKYDGTRGKGDVAIRGHADESESSDLSRDRWWKIRRAMDSGPWVHLT